MTDRVGEFLISVSLSSILLLIALTESAIAWPFVVVSALGIWYPFQARVEIRPWRDELISYTGFTRTVLKLSSVANVRVPPLGALCITVDSGVGVTKSFFMPVGAGHAIVVRLSQGRPRKTNIVTALSGKQGRGTTAHELAGVLDVPVVSIWPGTSTGDDRWQWDTTVRAGWLLRSFLVALVILVGIVLLLLQIDG